jgi:methionine-R-sulfoxide reductase/methionine-S-sulfoxide reductase
MFSLAFVSFIAGILTILAPCVLPVLPVILAGSIGEKWKWYPYIITGSLAFSIVFFTVLLKASTLLIDVPSEFWKYLSWIILLWLGFVYIFPHAWTSISCQLFGSRANAGLDKAQNIESSTLRAIVTGAVLGPVFSTCSPTYTLLLATVFPVSFFSGIVYIFIYALGLSLVLLLISKFGSKLIQKLKIYADERWIFRKILGIILLLVWLAILTGLDKRLETTILQKYDIPSIETSVINQLSTNFNHMNNTPILPVSDTKNLKKAYFAGGCFWCMEGIFEAQEWVISAISWYAEGTLADATYERVSSGNTTHREAVEVTYDPARISYPTLVDLYYTQIDPTQVDGQFADRGFRYTTAIYHQDDVEKDVIENARKVLESKKKYDTPIAVKTVPFTTFFPAEEYHQDYYKKSAFRYNLYKEGSGRAGFIHENAETGATLVSSSNQQYKDYEDAILSTLTGSRILLFFHASWCPTCQNFEKQILKSTLPKDVVILKVDYDTATELKKKYSVLSQSTFVQVDSEWNMYKRWLGKSELTDILSDMATPQDLLSKKLTPLQFQVTQMGGTEKPFDNAYWDNHEAGIYVDIVDGTPLFSSLDKFDSGTGWPSFTRPIDTSMVDAKSDKTLYMERTEIVSKNANSHLGHVFDDGPQDQWGKRYCINSAALRFVPVADLEKEGYEKYVLYFDKP